jgi:hypothetical protein
MSGGRCEGIREGADDHVVTQDLDTLLTALYVKTLERELKGQLDLEQHGGRTFTGVAVRITQRLLAMTAAIWHNNKTGAPITRSLIAYDH